MIGRGSSKGSVGSFSMVFFLSFASRMQEDRLNNELTWAGPRLVMMCRVLYTHGTVPVWMCTSVTHLHSNPNIHDCLAQIFKYIELRSCLCPWGCIMSDHLLLVFQVGAFLTHWGILRAWLNLMSAIQIVCQCPDLHRRGSGHTLIKKTNTGYPTGLQPESTCSDICLVHLTCYKLDVKDLNLFQTRPDQKSST